MAHILFYPKEGIKLLITEEPSPNLPLQFTAKRVSNNEYQFRCHLTDPSEIDQLLRFNHTPRSIKWNYFDYQKEAFAYISWTESLRSIIRLHEFYKPMLYWYLIS